MDDAPLGARGVPRGDAAAPLKRFAAVAVFGALLAGNSRSAPQAPPPEAISFRDVTKTSGVALRYASDMRRGHVIGTMGGGIAMGDFDGDSYPDLFLTGSAASGKKPLEGPCGALFRNRGDGRFEDVTGKSGVHACGWTNGASFLDFDSDGALDLVVTALGRTFLYRGDGHGLFQEEGERLGFAAPLYAIGLAAGDVDADGRVDLYVVNYLDTNYAKEQTFPSLSMRTPDDYQGQPALLFVQGTDGRFTERAEKAGAANAKGKGLQAVFFDYDGDSRPDLYVANDRAPNVLYRGKGDGRFEDVTAETGAGARDHPQARAGMGIAVGDLDGDEFPELFVTNFAGEPNTLYRNVEGQLFDEVSDAWGVSRASLPYVQWGTELADLDDDGHPDAVAVSGQLVPKWLTSLAGLFRKGGLGVYGQGDRSYRQPPVVWRNTGDGHLSDVTAGSGDFARLTLCARGLAAGDVDGDGRLDLAIHAVEGRSRLLRNTSPPGGHALEILPLPGADRRTALGTKVRVTAGGRKQLQEFILRPSYASGSWVPLHFGLGDETSAIVEVFPPGETRPRFVFEGVAAGRLYTLKDGELTVRREFRR